MRWPSRDDCTRTRNVARRHAALRDRGRRGGLQLLAPCAGSGAARRGPRADLLRTLRSGGACTSPCLAPDAAGARRRAHSYRTPPGGPARGACWLRARAAGRGVGGCGPARCRAPPRFTAQPVVAQALVAESVWRTASAHRRETTGGRCSTGARAAARGHGRGGTGSGAATRSRVHCRGHRCRSRSGGAGRAGWPVACACGRASGLRGRRGWRDALWPLRVGAGGVRMRPGSGVGGRGEGG